MRYETPELTPLTPAINAIQDIVGKMPHTTFDALSKVDDEGPSAYQDWE